MDMDITNTSIEEYQTTAPKAPVPILMVAHAPRDAATIDRCRLSVNFTVGRRADNHLTIRDHKMSGRHLRIFLDGGRFAIEDQNSTNGTYLNGERLTEKRPLTDNAVIRAGHTVLVFHSDGEELLTPPPIERYGIAGQFYVAPLLRQIEEDVLSNRDLLISGPTGSGKELAANAVAAMLSEKRGKKVPLIPHNCAKFISEDEATSHLFGVANKVFTGVESRSGLIERAEGGVLFLDEIHNLSQRVQRSLLRVIQNREYTRFGETAVRVANVRFVMASNAPNPRHSMAHDLFARLRLVVIPSLKERVADIPSIFDYVMRSKLDSFAIPHSSVMPCFKGKHYALMCLNGMEENNVRGLIDLADRIVTKIAARTPAPEAIATLFAKTFDDYALSIGDSLNPPPPISPPDDAASFVPPPASDKPKNNTLSRYEKYKELIIATYKDREEKISPTVRALNARGITCSRRFLASYLRKWGVRKSPPEK